MSIKPFKKVIEDKNTPSQDKVKPFRKYSNKEETFQSFDESQIPLKKVNFFSTFGGLLFAFFFFVLLAVIADTIDTFQTILSQGTIANYIYLSGLIFLSFILLVHLFLNLKQLRLLHTHKNIQEKFLQQQKKATKDIIPLTNTLLRKYKDDTNEDITQAIQYIQKNLKKSQIYEDIYQDLDTVLLPIIDAKAQAIINKASLQSALSTTISPYPLLDMILILVRSVTLTKEIATLYQIPPKGLSTFFLLKQAIFNITFAGVAELVAEATNEIAGRSVIAKISTSAGQGVANGILMARLGYGIMEACRPLPPAQKRANFIKEITNSLLKVFKENL
ncbi:Membrane protein YcjF [hydrothermal vent metagenome]|uniref:Membrane protein YcjF n=1 Tax=hydrothermal vent metagenome TaxID=652676 RepID=A0A1W1D2F4_9ZZZZ